MYKTLTQGSGMTFILSIETWFKVTAHPLPTSTMSQIGISWEKIWSWQGFFHRGLWFKVISHPLNLHNLWVDYKPDWTKGREDLLQTSDSIQTNRQADGWTDSFIYISEQYKLSTRVRLLQWIEESGVNSFYFFKNIMKQHTR